MYNPELLSPVGDFECLKAAVQNGANSVYLGASSFSARAKATNFGEKELEDAIKYCKSRNVSVHLALNTLIKNNEFQEAASLALKAYNLGVDAIIIQDLGLSNFILENYPEIPLHASTQMTVTNLAGVKQLENLGFKRVVLARELSLKDIEYIRKNTDIELEVFIHGALCISYSGQCLLSSMIGGRSGNRGLCAQPCRLPYKLYENDSKNRETELDSGFLLSPRDNCAIELLPELIKLGINSFKIEGRMKTPFYVATVTRIYRKYIDLVLDNIDKSNDEIRSIISKNLDKTNDDTLLSDREELNQAFNRGEFSTAHFSESPNRDLIYKYKSNNQGLYLGKITHINEAKGHLTLTLENKVSVGDKIKIGNEQYTISELMIDNKNYSTVEKSKRVKIGRMKGPISVGNKIYKIEDSMLNKSVSPTFKENKELKRIHTNCEITIKRNTPIELKITSTDGFYNGIDYIEKSSSLPQEAINAPIAKETIINQLMKTGNTPITFDNITVLLDDGLFIPMGIINEIRRNAIENFINSMLSKRIKPLKEHEVDEYPFNSATINSDKKISILLNNLNSALDYSQLTGIDRLYIPLKFFMNSNYSNIIKNISTNFKTYIYMPNAIKDRIIDKVDFAKILSSYNISGFVISHISQVEIVKKYNLELIGNYSLNVFSNYSITLLKKLGLNSITISPELEKDEINNICNNASEYPTELIVYGKIPVMTSNYCLLGKTNKCYPECDKKCLNQNCTYYLKDRMDFSFRIVPDNISTITTIYNSKTLSINPNAFNTTFARIDILDENNIETIQEIINYVKSGQRFEGNQYTNGRT